jgi:hypothetical protein
VDTWCAVLQIGLWRHPWQVWVRSEWLPIFLISMSVSRRKECKYCKLECLFRILSICHCSYSANNQLHQWVPNCHSRKVWENAYPYQKGLQGRLSKDPGRRGKHSGPFQAFYKGESTSIGYRCRCYWWNLIWNRFPRKRTLRWDQDGRYMPYRIRRQWLKCVWN